MEHAFHIVEHYFLRSLTRRLEVHMAQAALTGTRAVDRATSLLAHIITTTTPPHLQTLAREFDIPKSTASRIISALERQGFVKRDRNGAFLPGEVLTQFAREQNQDSVLVTRMRPILEDLARQTGETANLAITGNGYLKIIDQVDSLFMLGTTNWIGKDVPYHCSALGKVLLAYGAIPIQSGSLQKLTSKSINTRSRLLAELEAVRKIGYAIIVDELEEGLAAVSAPVRESDGRVLAAISISGPTTRLSQKELHRIGQLIVDKIHEETTPFKNPHPVKHGKAATK